MDTKPPKIKPIKRIKNVNTASSTISHIFVAGLPPYSSNLQSFVHIVDKHISWEYKQKIIKKKQIQTINEVLKVKKFGKKTKQIPYNIKTVYIETQDKW